MIRAIQFLLSFTYLVSPAPLDLSLQAAIIPIKFRYSPLELIPVAMPAPIPAPIPDTYLVPTVTPLPKHPTSYITIVLNEHQVYVDRVGKPPLRFPIATGKAHWKTPIGRWKVRNMYKNPDWTNFVTRKIVPAGLKNPLGSRWIGFWTDGKDEIGFHATRDLNSVGKSASHGCVRMREADIKQMYDLVSVGTVVDVITNDVPGIPHYLVK